MSSPARTATSCGSRAGCPEPSTTKRAEWIWGILDGPEKAGIVVLADSGYQGSTHAHVPFKKRRGGGLLDSEKDANRAHARLRAPGERANAQLKSWNILRKARCCPTTISKLAKAIHVLQMQEAA